MVPIRSRLLRSPLAIILLPPLCARPAQGMACCACFVHLPCSVIAHVAFVVAALFVVHNVPITHACVQPPTFCTLQPWIRWPRVRRLHGCAVASVDLTTVIANTIAFAHRRPRPRQPMEGKQQGNHLHSRAIVVHTGGGADSRCVTSGRWLQRPGVQACSGASS